MFANEDPNTQRSETAVSSSSQIFQNLLSMEKERAEKAAKNPQVSDYLMFH